MEFLTEEEVLLSTSQNLPNCNMAVTETGSTLVQSSGGFPVSLFRGVETALNRGRASHLVQHPATRCSWGATDIHPLHMESSWTGLTSMTSSVLAAIATPSGSEFHKSTVLSQAPPAETTPAQLGGETSLSSSVLWDGGNVLVFLLFPYTMHHLRSFYRISLCVQERGSFL